MKKFCVICKEKKEETEFVGSIVDYVTGDAIEVCMTCKDTSDTHMYCDGCNVTPCWVSKDIMKLTDHYHTYTGEQECVCPQNIYLYTQCDCGLYTQEVETGVCVECRVEED